MSSLLGSLRRLALAPTLSDVSFAGRSFPVPPSARTVALERIPQAVVGGFEWGVDTAADPTGRWELQRRLELIAPDLQGFAYEGAAMAAVVLDAMSGFRGRRTETLLAGPARPHLFLAYIGIGFAMARLPRPLWCKVLPELPGVAHHPTLSWLAVDGYAFDRAFFDTDRWVDEQLQPPAYPWQGRADYFPRAVDQGIGRALWFIHGAAVERVVAAVDRFPAPRRADLWSGVGLAAAVAGGVDEAELRTLRAAAGPHRTQLGLGAVFAATARQAAGVVPEHTGWATRALAGLDVAGAVALGAATAVTDEHPGAEPAYERWRTAIRTALAGRGLADAGPAPAAAA